MEPVKLDRKALPGELTVAEYGELIDLLRLQGYNALIGSTDETNTRGARLHENEQYRAFENAVWYTIADITWRRMAGSLITDGYERHDDGPVPTFNKGDKWVYLARLLCGLQWYPMPATPPASKEDKLPPTMLHRGPDIQPPMAIHVLGAGPGQEKTSDE